MYHGDKPSMNRLSKWKLLLTLMLTLLFFAQPIAADDTTEILTQRLLVEGRYAIVTNGVGMTGSSSASFDLDVPGTVYRAYLYWAGYDDGSGDDTIDLQVDGGAATTLTADETFTGFWFNTYDRYVYVEDVTELAQSGNHTYTVSNFSDGFHFRDGAGLLVVYEDANLPYNRVEVKDGLDRMYRWWGSGPRAESAVNCFDVPAHPIARTMSLNIFGTGVDISGNDRPNAIWYRTGDGSAQPDDMLDTPTDGPVDAAAVELQGPPDYPFQSVNGEEWDTYTNTLTIPANDTWVCLQVESAKYLNYQPASFAHYVAAATYEIGAAIGDTVWFDTDQDGIQDAGESGIDNVTVHLYDDTGTLTDTTTTDGTGTYEFDDLAPGDYYLDFVLPSGYAFTDQNQGGDDALDSDANPTTGETSTTTLDPGEIDLTWDAGLYLAPAEIGDFVWNDLNQDGVQDGGESGIQGVTVSLLNTSDTVVATMTTDINGEYLFSDVAPGDYYLEFELPSEYGFTDQNQGGDDALDSDADPTTGKTATTTLTFGESDLTWDVGVVALASIGDFVWRDTDTDGIQDAGEVGIDGVTVNLYRDGGDGDSDPDTSTDDTLIATTVTDVDGNYTFTDLPPGDYFVEFESLIEVVFSPVDVGGDDTEDSDADPINPSAGYATRGRTPVTTLDPDEYDPTWDAGICCPPSEIGNFVWEDQNRNGIQDSGEPGIPNVVIKLYTPGQDGAIGGGDDGFVISTTTTASGYYTFTRLVPNQYYVEFVLPDDYAFTDQNQGGDDNVDSDPDVTLGLTEVFALPRDTFDDTWDAGLFKLGAIGNRVWTDLDRDGIQDTDGSDDYPHPVPLSGLVIELYQPGSDGEIDSGGDDDVLIDTTTTDASGYYTFTGLVAGDYFLKFYPRANHQITLQDEGGDDAVDSDADPNTGLTGLITLSTGEIDLTWDMGLYALAAVGDYVWQDADADGVQDETESGIGGVTVELYDSSDTLISTTTTAEDGFYYFTEIEPGDYYLVFTRPSGYHFTLPNEGGDDGLDSDADGTGTTTTFNLDFAEVDVTWDAGLVTGLDFGDLPDTYGTLIASDGARHTSGNLHLGAAFDTDPDGSPSADAAGDDVSDASDDEDGIVRDPGDRWQPGSTVHITATVTGGTGLLVSWFDWNDDGSFDISEQISFGFVSTGDNALSLTVGNDYTTGLTLNTRFRLYAGEPSTTSPTGMAINGEVEDYQWGFQPTAISLTALRGHSSFAGIPSLLAVLGGMGLLGWIGIKRRTRKRH
jgi:protocatechuate 3,4-dioxygenase beta subunit